MHNNYINQIICKSSVNMSELPDKSIHLVVTSPPYNVGKEYEEEMPLEDYLMLIDNVIKESKRVLVDGGRICLNIANIFRSPYIPLNAFVTNIMLSHDFLMRGEIIWDKGASVGESTAWGSWISANNPTLRDVHEYILVFSKDNFKRQDNTNKTSTIKRDEFLEYTKSIWRFPTEKASRVGHPSPFPVELPKRLIKLYTYKGDIVLDPFMGSGTTAVAAVETGRKYVGYDDKIKYCKRAKHRIKRETSEFLSVIKGM